LLFILMRYSFQRVPFLFISIRYAVYSALLLCSSLRTRCTQFFYSEKCEVNCSWWSTFARALAYWALFYILRQFVFA
jgi:hypothetical protein